MSFCQTLSFGFVGRRYRFTLYVKAKHRPYIFKLLRNSTNLIQSNKELIFVLQLSRIVTLLFWQLHTCISWCHDALIYLKKFHFPKVIQQVVYFNDINVLLTVFDYLKNIPYIHTSQVIESYSFPKHENLLKYLSYWKK